MWSKFSPSDLSFLPLEDEVFEPKVLFFFFLAMSAACGIYLARDPICTTAATLATVVTTLVTHCATRELLN